MEHGDDNLEHAAASRVGSAMTARRIIVPLAFVCALGPAAAEGHQAALVVSRDSTAHPKLLVSAPRDYLDRRATIPLLPGDDRFKGFWISDAPGVSAIDDDRLMRGHQRLVPGHRVALELVRADAGFAMLDPGTWKVVLARPGQKYEFFRDADGRFNIQMISRASRAGIHDATFRFVDLAHVHAPSDLFRLRFETRETPIADADTSLPATYREAIQRLWSEATNAEAALAGDEISRVSTAAGWAMTVIQALPALARSDSSGVSAAAQSRVGTWIGAMGAATARLHGAADLGDASRVREQLAILRPALDTLTSYAPREYACPMGCRDGKTYTAPGNCPVCGMKLMDTLAHLDHTPKHGGVLVMTPDLRYHLETTFDSSDLRVYFYDEYTKPIAATSFRARVEIPGDRAAVALEPEATAECLGARLPARARSSRQLKLVVHFGEGEADQTFAIDVPRTRTESRPRGK